MSASLANRSKSTMLSVALVASRHCFVALPPSLILRYNTRARAGPLVLAVQWQHDSSAPAQRAFVAWRGDSSKEGSLVVPVELARCLQLAEHTLVSVDVATMSPVESMLFIEPESVDDWEILELNQRFIEQNFLRQICVVTLNKSFPFYINDSHLIHLRASSAQSSASQSIGYARLEVQSEIAIAPKARVASASSTAIVPAHTPAKPVSVNLRVQGMIGSDDIHTVYVNPATIQLFGEPRESLWLMLSKARESRRYSDDFAPSIVCVRVLPLLSCNERHVLIHDALRTYLSIQLADNVSLTSISDQNVSKVPPHTPLSKCRLTQVEFVDTTDVNMNTFPVTVPHTLSWDSIAQAFRAWADTAPSTMMVDKSLIKLPNLPTFQFSFHAESVDAEGPSLRVSTVPRLYDVISGLRAASPSLDIQSDAAAAMSIELSLAPNARQMPLLSDVTERQRAPPLSAIGGVETITQSIINHIHSILSPSAVQMRARLGISAPAGFLIAGASGCGKSMLVHALCNQLRALVDVASPAVASSLSLCTIVFPCSLYANDSLPDLRRRFEKLCRDASMRRPSVVIFEDLDALFPAASEHDPSSGLITAQRTELFCDTFTALALRLNTSSSVGGVCLIATARSSATVGAPLRAPPLFSESYEIRPPNAVCRADILLRQLRVRGFAHSFDIDELAAGSEGYSGRDLSLLLDRIFLAAQARTQSECRRLQHEGQLLASAELCLSASDVSAAQLGFVPAALRDIPLQKSTVSWSDIGGLHSVRAVLKETLEMPTRYARLFENAPLKLRSGILLFGAPGTGKTLLASAVAKECGLNFITVKGPELLNKYIGASEASVRELFGRAAAAAPCVVFMDEFEAIAPQRGADSTGVTDRVVNQLLCHLDGVEGRSGVYVLAATSRPDMIDAALMRPGRLDKLIMCDFPDVDEREDILKAISRKMKLAPDVDLRAVAEHCKDFSGADLQAVLTTAQLNAVHALLDAIVPAETNSEDAETAPEIYVTAEHVQAAVSAARLSVSAADRARFARIYGEFTGSRQKAPQEPTEKPTGVGSRVTQM